MRPKSSIWQHFEKFDDTPRVKCKVNDCGECVQEDCGIAKRHLIRRHGISEEKDRLKWENDKYLLWKHFSRGDPFEARCNLCNLSFTNVFRQQIKRHLNQWHEEEVAKIKIEITSNSELSQYFIFEDSYATCKLEGCGSKVNIFEGIDHLAKYHDLNVYLGCEERTGDNKADGIIEKFVYKKNYAGPSSHHDNTHPQSLRNQEDDRMIQHSVDEGNYAGPSSYHNNSHPQSLRNQEGQQGPATNTSVSTDDVMAPPAKRQRHKLFDFSAQSFRSAIEDIGAPYKSNYRGQQGSTSYDTPSDIDDDKWPDWVYM